MVKGQRKRTYTREYRESAVGLVLGQGLSVERAAADLAARVRELEAENRRLRIERDILKTATAFFAKEEGGRP